MFEEFMLKLLKLFKQFIEQMFDTFVFYWYNIVIKYVDKER